MNVEFLYLCEYGSKSYGIDHKDSDNDVAGVFVYKDPSVYQKPFTKTESVIDISDNNKLSAVLYHRNYFFEMVAKGNATAYDVVKSSKKYLDFFTDEEKCAFEECFNNRKYALYSHYAGLAKKTYHTRKRYFETGEYMDDKTLKHHLYVIRAILCSLHIATFDELPTTNFEKLVFSLQTHNYFTALEPYVRQMLWCRKNNGRYLGSEFYRFQYVNDKLIKFYNDFFNEVSDTHHNYINKDLTYSDNVAILKNALLV